MTTTSHVIGAAMPAKRFAGGQNHRRPPARRGAYPALKESLWQTVTDWLVPWGYEDAAGFHYGRQPDQLASNR